MYYKFRKGLDAVKIAWVGDAAALEFNLTVSYFYLNYFT